MKTLIIVPKYHDQGGFYQFPLGLGYVASAIEKSGHAVVALNLNELEQSDIIPKIKDVITSEKPRIVATGGLSGWANQVSSIFSLINSIDKNILKIVGGGMLGGEPEPVMRSTDADIGVIGEAEETIIELLKAIGKGLNLSNVDGIIFKSPATNKLERTKPRAAIKEIDNIPWPNYELLGFPKALERQTPTDSYYFSIHDKPKSIDMITSRSCPFSCTFCFHPAGKIYRERDLDQFIEELKCYIQRFGINTVMVVDELFSLRRNRLLDFCKKIGPLGLSWVVQLHVNSVDEEVLECMSNAGCVGISFGIESMDQDVLISMKKKSKIERIDKVLKMTSKSTIGIQGNLIFGDPAETIETANRSLEWWLKNRRWSGVHVNMLQVWPGSPVYVEAVRDGLILDRDNFVKSLPITRNVSAMNDFDHGCLSSILQILTITGFALANSEKIVPSNTIIQGRGQTWDIEYSCPHCNHHQTLNSCVIDENYWPLIRLMCKGCKRRVEVEVPRDTSISDEDQQQIITLIKKINSAQARDDKASYYDSLSKLAEFESYEKVVMASQMLMVDFYLERGRVNSALHILALGVRKNPKDLDFLKKTVTTFANLKLWGVCKVVCERILDIDPNDTDAKNWMVEMRTGLSDGDQQVMFRSFSDDPAPKRISVQRKKQKITHKDKLKLGDGRFDVEPEFTHLEPV